MTVALKKGWTSTARERYSSFVFDLDVLSHFLRIFEKAVPLISTNCWSLFRSVANCWKPSSRVVNLDERLEIPWRDLMTFFLSSKVLSRILSYVTVGDDIIQKTGFKGLVDYFNYIPRLLFADKKRSPCLTLFPARVSASPPEYSS
jgi:hypothetical protein